MSPTIATLGRLGAVVLLFLACESPTASNLETRRAWAQQRSGDRGSDGEFTRNFRLQDCTFQTEGTSPYFPLVPGQVKTYAGDADGEHTDLVITTTDQTMDVGGILTRVVEERESVDGELVEVSRNFFAHCQENNTVFYFGEEVDLYERGNIVGHEGSWRHGTAGASAGVIIPGLPLLGARYFQEVAPGIAMDRAEIVQMGAQATTPYQSFTEVVVTRETTPLEPGAVEFKKYAPGVGLIVDADLLLVSVSQP